LGTVNTHWRYGAKGSSHVVVDPSAPIGATEPLKEARERWLRVFEHAYLTDLLAKHDHNVTAAARAAGVDRIHLYRLLWRNGLK
jgi:DNA-binding NtrC family response regulator